MPLSETDLKLQQIEFQARAKAQETADGIIMTGLFLGIVPGLVALFLEDPLVGFLTDLELEKQLERQALLSKIQSQTQTRS